MHTHCGQASQGVSLALRRFFPGPPRGAAGAAPQAQTT
jgi:hypothetical protein